MMSFQSPVVAANKAVTKELDQDEEASYFSLMPMAVMSCVLFLLHHGRV